MMSHPLVSVVMSVYNGGRYLREAVDSILAQTFEDFEFIIIDDGSTDTTKEIIESYLDERIVLMHQENVGVTRALNKGIALARGKYVARQDADDVSKPQRLEKLVAHMEAHPEIGLLGTRFEAIDENGHVTRLAYLQYESEIVQERLLETNQFSHGSVIIRKDAIDAVGPFRDFFKYAQDYDLWLRISERYEVANLPEFLFCYRELAQAISSKKILAQSLYAGLAKEMAMQRRETGTDAIQQGLTPTLPSVQRLSRGLHNKLIAFYTQHPQEMLNGLDVGNSTNKDLIFLFKKMCVEKQQCEAELRAKHAELTQTDERVRSVLTEFHNIVLDRMDKQLTQRFKEVIEANNRMHFEELRQKDEQLRTNDEQIRHMHDDLLLSMSARAEANIKVQMLAEEIRQKESELLQKDVQADQHLTSLRQREDQIGHILAQLQQKDEQIGQSFAQVQQKDEQIGQSLAQVQQKDEQIGQILAQVQQKDEQIGQSLVQLQQKDEQIRQIGVQFAMERERHEGHIRLVGEQLTQLNLCIAEKEQQLHDKDLAIRHREEQLQINANELRALAADLARSTTERAVERRDYERQTAEKDQRIKDFLDSKSWKITAPIRKTLDILQRK